MEQIQWTDALSVGIPFIDGQHQEWIVRFNALASAVDRHLGPLQVAQTLSFLVDYTHEHFAAEEAQMTAHQYPALPEHAQLHASLKGTLKNLVQDFEEEGPTHDLAAYIDTFLRNWLITHIQQVDSRFGAFVRGE